MSKRMPVSVSVRRLTDRERKILALLRQHPAGVNEDWLHVHGADTKLLVQLYRRRLIQMSRHRVRAGCAELEQVRIVISADGAAALARSAGRQ
jgi:hypothetical protein